jgi:serine/tyrosine/threonine adenylyltransferase
MLRELPGERLERRGVRPVSFAAWSPVSPQPVSSPQLVSWSTDVAAELGLPTSLNDDERRLVADVFGGNAVWPGMRPHATRYGGHQFGHWAGQLGDGRAMSLGEVQTPSGAWLELQLKGAGPTPYSRSADGRAVLRSSLREYLCSEAMHFLGVPTTRALSLVRTGDGVVRDMFYDGRPDREPGAVVCRVAPSFLRFGHFQILAHDDEPELLSTLVRFTIRHFYPHLSIHDDEPIAPNVVVAFFEEVCARTIETVVHWQRVGFVHGVMNTDNMSILGLTIDYGPYGFVDGYDPDFTPNTTDASRRRYRFGQQPAVALWNLARLAEALSPLLVDERGLHDALLRAGPSMQQALGEMHRRKLGLTDVDVAGADDVIAALWPILQGTEVDFTLFFRALADVVRLPTERRSDDELWGLVAVCAYDTSAGSTAAWRAPILQWLRRYLALADGGTASPHARAMAMDRTNPFLLPRNWLAQEAIDAATALDLRPLERLLASVREPYRHRDDLVREAGKRPEWARHKAGCSMLSCSS